MVVSPYSSFHYEKKSQQRVEAIDTHHADEEMCSHAPICIIDRADHCVTEPLVEPPQFAFCARAV